MIHSTTYTQPILTVKENNRQEETEIKGHVEQEKEVWKCQANNDTRIPLKVIEDDIRQPEEEMRKMNKRQNNKCEGNTNKREVREKKHREIRENKDKRLQTIQRDNIQQPSERRYYRKKVIEDDTEHSKKYKQIQD